MCLLETMKKERLAVIEFLHLPLRKKLIIFINIRKEMESKENYLKVRERF